MNKLNSADHTTAPIRNSSKYSWSDEAKNGVKIYEIIMISSMETFIDLGLAVIDVIPLVDEAPLSKTYN